ncbi:AAA family ATPase [Radiobacillus kanasensis]|uniref:AAA family ATPase n=1 Tax=Radiobacillus kanasensis TaxID=2844358 RepID=UPI001E3A3E76|nr:AAA family ATPase [Radiobacillus kanasensis]UFU01373.1 AAA family ATPase [Radiobacillus kanasensis]
MEQVDKQWSIYKEIPPLSEIAALRFIDIYKDSEQVTNQQKANVYSMLAFYRLNRNYGDDKITETLLEEGEKLDADAPSLYELRNLKKYFAFYSDLSFDEIEKWSIRETDFEPAKLKKCTELKEEINKIVDRIGPIKDKESQLHELYKTIYHKLLELQELLTSTIEELELRRSSISVSHLNQYVKDLTLLKQQIPNHFPKSFHATGQKHALEKMDDMVGLKEVKQYVKQYYQFLKYQKERKELGFTMVDEPGLHMIMTGNPGTGKTTMARLLASIYYELGLLESNKLIEVNRSHLVGSYVGQSEEHTLDYVKQAIGGVLFIDEAYSLKREGQTGNDYGQAVIDTLVSSMTSKEYEGKFAVILAGYPEEMRQFLWSNPGLRSRFPEQNHMELPDFEMDELVKIAEDTALQNDYFFTEQALHTLRELIEKSRVDETFGNARTVRNLVIKAIFKKGAIKDSQSEAHWIDHMRLDQDDLSMLDQTNQDEEPIQQLDQLIGLANIKDEVKKLSSFVRVQQQRKEKGLPNVPIQLHAVFSGNPGTGKTTVANIYSKILNDCGLLKRGHVVVASRSDLVAGYVGQTAIKTKKKVREALGGVLFIDEAYSLFRGEKDFGKEAIDTLVDEMTKHNENLIVILAGYEQEMKQFISSNPGLESRFKKYLHFMDYNADELLEITKYHVQKYAYEIDEEAIHYIHTQYEEHDLKGNARFVVNLVDEAIQYQALRVEETSSIHDVNRIVKEDFEHAWTTLRRE